MSVLVEWDTPRFNIAPTQSILAVRTGRAGWEPVRLRWGLIPSWAKDTKLAATMINARTETVAEKPAFRKRRCIVPVNGFLSGFDAELVADAGGDVVAEPVGGSGPCPHGGDFSDSCGLTEHDVL